jgi:hypothetical protein
VHVLPCEHLQGRGRLLARHPLRALSLRQVHGGVDLRTGLRGRAADTRSARSDATTDATCDAGAHAAPVRRWHARLRQGRGRNLLPGNRRWRLRLRLCKWVCADRRTRPTAQRARVRRCDQIADAQPNTVADAGTDRDPHVDTNGESDRISYTVADASSHAAPVHHEPARVRQECRRRMLRTRGQCLRVRMQEQLLGELAT